MTLLLLILFILLGVCCFFSRHKKLGTVIFSVTGIIFFLLGSGLIAIELSKWLEPNTLPAKPQWQKNNVMVLLGAGAVKLPKNHLIQPTVIAYSRIYEAQRLYLACKKTKNTCRILISGGDALATGMSEAMVYRNALLNIGVNPADLILESKSMNTYKNAEFTRNILKKESFQLVVLVTSCIHMPRALLYFSHFGITALPAPADYMTPQISPIPLAYNFMLTDYLLHEYAGIARFYIYNWLGWN